MLKFFTNLDDSLMEQLQRHAPKARFVKAFSCVGNAFMVKPQLPGGPPTMFICGDDEAAKAWVRTILGLNKAADARPAPAALASNRRRSSLRCLIARG